MLRTGLAIGLAAVLTASGAFAQEETTVRTKTTTTTTGGQRFSVLLKSKVLIRDDQPAGQIVDVVFNEGGCVDYLVASYEDQYYVVPYSATQVRYADQIVFVDIAPTQFRKVQFFRGNNWPNFYANDFRTNVFTTFNVNTFRNEGNRTTFKPNADDRDDANNRNPKNREGADKSKKEDDKPTPRTERNPANQPDGEKSVNPKTPKKDDATPRKETATPEKKPAATPDKETKKPVDPPREPLLKNPPQPKPLPNPTSPLPKPTEPKLP